MNNDLHHLPKLKVISCSLTFLIVAISVHVLNAQVAPPNGFNYTAVARDAQNNALINRAIAIQFSIVQSSPTGTVVYREGHTTTTGADGTFNLVIGYGTPQTAIFSTINWSNDAYYLKVGMDANGGSNFVDLGTTQLISVPYALYARSAGSANSGQNIGYVHHIGELYGGGVVCYVFKDTGGVEHGMVLALSDQSNGAIWGLDSLSPVIINQNLLAIDGATNSNFVISHGGLPNEAVGLCHNYHGGGYNDWYLPSVGELLTILNNLYQIQRTLNVAPAASPLANASTANYWSSGATIMSFYHGCMNCGSGNSQRTAPNYVRAVRMY